MINWKEFVNGGNATFTVEIPHTFQEEKGTPDHYTYRIVRKDGPRPVWFAGLLAGPDNNSDYQYMGMYYPYRTSISLTGKSRYNEDSMPVRMLNRILARIQDNSVEQMEASGFRLHHEGKCCVCGRKLTTPESIETGIGPVCAGKG